MDKEKPCEPEGKLFDDCIEKQKFVPRCIESLSAWDKCMSEYQKLTLQQSKVEVQPTQKNARDMGNPVS